MISRVRDFPCPPSPINPPPTVRTASATGLDMSLRTETNMGRGD